MINEVKYLCICFLAISMSSFEEFFGYFATACLFHLEKAMAPHSSTLAWKIPWMEEPGGCSPWGCQELDTTERLHFLFSLSCIGEGNGKPLQYSCLENPRDGGACWAAVYGVAQSWTRLKRLSSSSLFHWFVGALYIFWIGVFIR